MPRRNRNAHVPAIDTDELAAQAAQLTAELGSVHIPVSYLVDEIQPNLDGIPRAGKSTLIRDYFISYIQKHPGCQISLTDRKAVTSHGR